jgi:Uma2 family endonuclease
MSAADYLAWERTQQERHEFFDGEVFAMSGGSLRHAALAVHIGRLLAERLPRCTIFSTDARIGIEDGRRYVYPDLSVVCGAFLVQPGSDDVLLNPGLIVEVLSASTEPYDRGEKWASYQGIESLTHYLLVSQSRPRIELFQRPRGGPWGYFAFGLGGQVALLNNEQLAVDAVYYPGIFDVPGE